MNISELFGAHRLTLAYSSVERKRLEIVVIIGSRFTKTTFLITAPKFSHTSDTAELALEVYESIKTAYE